MTQFQFLGTGAAFGNHCTTTEQWKAGFRGLPRTSGVAECDLDFADRVLNACLLEPAFIKALIAEAAASKADLPDEVARARDEADQKLAAHGIPSP
ncbi:unnamed protein product [Polarella glacialis]|uniref:Uncharacterized protein n=1 Tax=Polarella glacialis TaxID=89957 RepID=A0A813L3W5_POLGL|nr:unnamed protein product [Polarella glacialis]|mmetsp:Transcript_50636/g.82170  ORF Transcript_50636/g.82170 Transcript_50636/m.82170 type:complete len:96 (+) Transcript_50636:62-349(+)|eukprot:CAMPEP_0115095820 /NCGR_PEP_ID=MMETSP0227-20121206/29305_1 /TAXON_ID=89957 /ORGANISM="Polarella glacialis, Strain CCMP 1383" /LENGTH=95 /DNA_ID=CAMNT_0002489335 /DNA_START=66 /DNA_END=353 /DNA_ORIENTATION=+